MNTLPLKGHRSLRVLNVFHALMLGLKMLPEYLGESYEDFFDRISEMDAASQARMIREAAMFIELQPEDVEACLSFCADANGVSISAANVKNLSPGEILDGIVAVCAEVGKMKIDLVTDAEKKN